VASRPRPPLQFDVNRAVAVRLMHLRAHGERRLGYESHVVEIRACSWMVGMMWGGKIRG